MLTASYLFLDTHRNNKWVLKATRESQEPLSISAELGITGRTLRL